LKKEFASYFQNNGLSFVVLHGPRGEMECKLIIRRQYVKLGASRKNFSALHELSAEGHSELFFEVESKKPSIHIKVHYPLIWFKS